MERPTPINWDARFSEEGRRMRMPTMQGVVARYVAVPGLVGLHAGKPPPDTFPFCGMHFTQTPAPAATAAAPANGAGNAETQQQPQQPQQLHITDAQAVAAAQQYMFQPMGYPPLQAWARELVCRLHHPATLQPRAAAAAAATAGAAPHPSSSADGGGGLDVVITPGASAALDALARILTNPGDPVLVEEYSYSHHLDAHLLTRGCELVPVHMDAHGIIPAHLDQVMTQRQAGGLPLPRLLYTIPTGQNPTGATMTPQRMAQVYRLAQKWDLVVIEDDAYYWLRFDQGSSSSGSGGSGSGQQGDEPAAAGATAGAAGQQGSSIAVPGLALPAGLLSLDTDGRVVRVDTFAKLLGPGYRLGWVAGPRALVNRVALHTAAVSVGACSTSQVILHELLTAWGTPGFHAFLQQLQRKYAAQAAAAEAAAQRHLADVAEWAPVTAGMFMWMRLRDGADASFLLQAGAEHKVMIVPGYLTSAQHLQALASQHYQQMRLGQGQGATQRPSEAAASSAGANGQQPGQQASQPPLPCPYFRVSFASVSAEQLEDGFARLQQAILSHTQGQ